MGASMHAGVIQDLLRRKFKDLIRVTARNACLESVRPLPEFLVPVQAKCGSGRLHRFWKTVPVSSCTASLSARLLLAVNTDAVKPKLESFMS
mmetsp:Transcript_18195/g.35586  ORF Transcript_18195/g.35586 Transcript_18195/m.35586 type:complete len:92 (-) Transcript_18195:163-438(-)